MSVAKRRDIAKECVDGLRLIRDKLQKSAKDNTLIVGITPEEVKYIINNSIFSILTVQMLKKKEEENVQSNSTD